MRTNSSWKDYFVFSKKERRIVIGLLVVLIAYSLLLLFYQPKTEAPTVENLNDAIAKLSSQSRDSIAFEPGEFGKETASLSTASMPVQLFSFDPNTLDEQGWKRLGLPDKTIHTIINYRNKGGHFYKPDDLKKIYGLTTAEADKLLPFVIINSGQNKNQSYASTGESFTKNQSFFSRSKPEAIDVNSATIEQWKTLPAIGEVLSRRIVNYRDKMGGFASLEQIKKTYGLTDSAYQIILPYLRLASVKTTAEHSTPTQKININTATADELKTNPSIPAEVAEAIVIYRKQHGKYSSVEDIKKIVFIKESLYQTIAPFLTAE